MEAITSLQAAPRPRCFAVPRRKRAGACKQLRDRKFCRDTVLRQPLSRRGRRVGPCATAEPLVPLGHDFLKFLAAFVVITPAFKRINVSPILGFLLAGVLLRQLNALAGPSELSELAELGVLFLLFEMGLELSSDRLRALRTFAFGLGSAQVLITTIAFVAFAVPFGASIGTLLLQKLAYADVRISSITSWDEAIVIAVALSLSSSAFVLQLLGDRGQLASRSGSATLGILLLQDIVTVPFLVLLPLLEAPGAQETIVAELTSPHDLATHFLPAVAQSLGLIGGIATFGRIGLRRAFELVAATGSNDAFVAASLLTVCGTSLATEAAGFGQTLGAFLAGILLAESSFRPQVEAEIRPFKGVLLGLFFLCTGAAVDVHTLAAHFPTIALLTIGLISIKFTITSVLGRTFFGLTEAESIKVGLTLAQGGEFAFVLLALAQDLHILPDDLNRLLICVVVASMACTPFLADVGDYFETREATREAAAEGLSLRYELMDPDAPSDIQAQIAQGHRGSAENPPAVLLAFNEASQVVANMLSSPLTGHPVPWLAFSSNPAAVRAANAKGLPVVYGDGSSADVLHAAGVAEPRAFILTHRSHPQLMAALEAIRATFPAVPCFALCIDVRRAAEAQALGACAVVTRASAGVALGDAVLRGLMDTSYVDLIFLEQEMQLAVLDAVDDAVRERKASARPGVRERDDSNAGAFILDFKPAWKDREMGGRAGAQQIRHGSQRVARLIELSVRGRSTGDDDAGGRGGGKAKTGDFFSPVLPSPAQRSGLQRSSNASTPSRGGGAGGGSGPLQLPAPPWDSSTEGSRSDVFVDATRDDLECGSGSSVDQLLVSGSGAPARGGAQPVVHEGGAASLPHVRPDSNGTAAPAQTGAEAGRVAAEAESQESSRKPESSAPPRQRGKSAARDERGEGLVEGDVPGAPGAHARAHGRGDTGNSGAARTPALSSRGEPRGAGDASAVPSTEGQVRAPAGTGTQAQAPGRTQSSGPQGVSKVSEGAKV